MNRTELTLIIASALVLAVLFGWCLRWFFGIFNRPTEEGPIDENTLVAALQQAQDEKAEAEQRMADVERDLTNRLTQANAELQAAMEGIGSARREAEELRSEIDKLKAG